MNAQTTLCIDSLRFIVELIDGKRSLRDMVVLMEQQRLMSHDEAE